MSDHVLLLIVILYTWDKLSPVMYTIIMIIMISNGIGSPLYGQCDMPKVWYECMCVFSIHRVVNIVSTIELALSVLKRRAIPSDIGFFSSSSN